MELKYTIETQKRMISRIFKKDEFSRNNYAWLYFKALEELGYKIIVDRNVIPSMPSPESICRIARQIQNKEQKYTPNEEVAQRRAKLSTESIGLWRNSQYA